MRVKNSIKNIYMSILTQVVVVLLGFISRKVFLDNLGTEYLGINGLISNVLSMLSLVEGGIGTSIVYNLYKPLAEKNVPKIVALVQLYKKIYTVLAVLILLISTLFYPLLSFFIKDATEIPFIGIVYFILVLKNMISYLNAHKWSLINADQKGYILAKYGVIFHIISTISKIFILMATKNYILFLIIELIIFTIQTIFNGYIVNKNYPYIKTKNKYKIEQDVKQNLNKNVKALFLHNIGTYCVFSTDNLLISSLVGVKSVGLYSNYLMITTQLESLLKPILGGIGASVGNLIATEGENKNYNIFRVTYLINFWIYSLSVIFLYNLLEPFINWWLGPNLLIDKLAFIFILVNLYISGLRSSIGTFKTKAGIFVQDKYAPLVESVINLASSILLAKKFGLAGILMGTTISTICVPFWIAPVLAYKNVFKKPVYEYFKTYILYILITLATGTVSSIICNFLVTGFGFMDLVFKGMICVIVPNIIYVIIFRETKEFKYLLSIVRPLIYDRFYKQKLSRL